MLYRPQLTSGKKMGEDNVTHLWTEWLGGVAEAPTLDRPWNVRRTMKSTGLRSSRREKEKLMEKWQEGHSVLYVLTEEVTGFQWDGLPTLSQFLKCSLPVNLAPFPQLVSYRTYIYMENRSKSHGRSFLKAVMEAVSQSSPRGAFVPSPTVLIQLTELNSTNQHVHRELNLVLFTKKSNMTKRAICPFLCININLLLPFYLRHTAESWVQV